ncbi:peptidase S53 [Alicyclobacillus cycloheptanicus]|uniref:Subtilase family serine protease n=1 Tax=Alicyclobacillus cycloheptanicus TaxID=1457 RepID=A0ABT9XJ66_9BACL|nr:protease pro-enzyme activation domain-containing protein [Alicyclobacillus cycloheptanicus]MDQ0190359.1 subtilase family serine protease [Alicyclobacillus cycloheptanicus]WDM00005.1 peptidase S53 [Alicyclobacillus cycloheptanicus]
MMKKKAWIAVTSASLTASGLLFAAATPAMANQTVSQGVASPAAQNATVFGDTPADQPVTVSIILKTRNESQLDTYIQQTVTPGSPNYRKFLTTQQFAQAYGQSPQVIQAIVSYFQSYGITSQVYPDNLDITLNGTAGQFNQAFGVTLQNMQYKGQKFHGVKQNPKVPSSIANVVLAVLGLTNYAPFTSSAVHTSASVLQKGAVSYTPADGANTPANVETPQDLENLYDVSPLIKKGDLGQGQTIGIVTLASLNPSDAYAFWNAYGIPSSSSRISLVNVDGGAGTPSLAAGSDETTLDVEQSGALAPDANIIVYQAPNTDYGFVDAFFDAASENKVGSLSASWGLSEDAVNAMVASGQETPNYAQAFNEAFEEAAAQGISNFAATGDYGAYQATSDLGTTDLSVGNPADSPYVTAAGGTTLPSSDSPILQSLGISIPAERAWAWDYLFPLWQEFGAPDEQTWAEENAAGGNGGYSDIFAEPSYQQGISGVNRYSAVQWFTPIDQNSAWSFNPTPPVVTGTSNGGRAMPDLSMNADPYTGYAIYSTLFSGTSLENAGIPNWSAGWGGTSFVAPQLNGIAALINTANHGRVGFWNPQIYSFAKQHASPLHPLDTTGTSNDNLYYSGTPGTIYNPATGLGTPDVAKLAADFVAGSAK